MIKKVSIVISVYNEEDNLFKLYEEIKKYIDPILTCQFELIFVNDGSTDNSFDILMDLHFQDKRIYIVNFSRNFGHEIAMTAGMDYATGDCVIFMDADLQHPPKLLPKMVQLWMEGTEVVLTNRVDNKVQNAFRKIMNSLFYKIIDLLSDTKIPANTPDFRLIDRKYVEYLKKMEERERMFRGLLIWIGIPNHKKIDFVAEKRYSGQTKYNFLKSLNLAFNSITQFSVKPLRFSMIFSFLLFFVVLGIGVVSLYNLFALDKTASGFTTMAIVLSLISAIQLLTTGINGEYIGKIHQESQKRPLYVASYISTETEEIKINTQLNDKKKDKRLQYNYVLSNNRRKTN